MKKILLFVSCFLFALTSCEIDNYEGPDASIHGSILDEQTGELVGSDMENGNAIKVLRSSSLCASLPSSWGMILHLHPIWQYNSIVIGSGW